MAPALAAILAVYACMWLLSLLGRTSAFAAATEVLSPLLAVAVAFVSTAFYSQHSHPRAQLVAVIQVAWGLRLALFTGSRLMFFGKDPRLDRFRENNKARALLFASQAAWIAAISLPTLVSAAYLTPQSQENPVEQPLNLQSLTNNQHQMVLSTKDYLGISIFTIGFLIEVLADQTKLAHKFVQITSNQPMIHCERGLWFYSQHPNYFGEILIWLGAAVVAWQEGLRWHAKLAIITAPAATTLTILFVTGIPLADYRAAATYGMFQEFCEYRKQTSKFIPMPRSLHAWIRRNFLQAPSPSAKPGQHDDQTTHAEPELPRSKASASARLRKRR